MSCSMCGGEGHKTRECMQQFVARTARIQATSDDPDHSYRLALVMCGNRYDAMSRNCTDVDLQVFIQEFTALAPSGPIPKLCRWLGYIQGTLIAYHLTTVEAERDYTRPLFRPLDYPDA